MRLTGLGVAISSQGALLCAGTHRRCGLEGLAWHLACVAGAQGATAAACNCNSQGRLIATVKVRLNATSFPQHFACCGSIHPSGQVGGACRSPQERVHASVGRALQLLSAGHGPMKPTEQCCY